MAKAQKELLAQINAMASHKMNNPVNSLSTHSIYQEQLCKELETLSLKTKVRFEGCQVNSSNRLKKVENIRGLSNHQKILKIIVQLKETTSITKQCS